MKHHPPIDYATPRDRPTSAIDRGLVALACCLIASWLGWLLLYKLTTNPSGFEDEVFRWRNAVYIMAYPGTVCGMVLYMPIVSVMLLRYLWAKKSRGSAS